MTGSITRKILPLQCFKIPIYYQFYSGMGISYLNVDCVCLSRTFDVLFIVNKANNNFINFVCPVPYSFKFTTLNNTR